MPEKARKQLNRRVMAYLTLVVFILASLTARLFYLQVVKAAEFEVLSKKNRVRLVAIPARRGDILDRNGTLLAASRPVFTVSLDATGLPRADLERVAGRLAELLGDSQITPEVVLNKVRDQVPRYQPVEVARLPWSTESWVKVSYLEERRGELPGVTINEVPERYYPGGVLAGHLLGYVGQISEEELKSLSGLGYGLNDRIGKSGLEKTFDARYMGENDLGLRGKKGFKQVEVNAANQPVRELVPIAPTAGNTLVLTLDADLQRAMETALDQAIAEVRLKDPRAAAGAAVAIDVNSGAILAMVSRPELNPNDFIDGSYNRKKAYYENWTLRPLFNRAIQESYAPGSAFKPITGIAALISGNVKPADTIVDPGYYWKPPYIECLRPHGVVDMDRAFAVSCNTYFQWAGELAGIELIDHVGAEFGLGLPTGLLDIAGEVAGVLPSPQWRKDYYTRYLGNYYQAELVRLDREYQEQLADNPGLEERALLEKSWSVRKQDLDRRYREDLAFQTRWWPFNTYNTSIGQDDNKYTPLQLANYVAALASGGRRYQPYLVSKIISPYGRVLQEFKPKLIHQADIPQEVMAQVRRGMHLVTASAEGTARWVYYDFPSSIGLGAKTGTAQVGRPGDYHTNGVFVAFAPVNNPRIALAAVIEYAENGSGSAGKVVRAVLDKYFDLAPAAIEE